MDIDMPVLNGALSDSNCSDVADSVSGFEASTRIRAYEAKHKLPKAPIVAVTAIRDDAAIARGKNE
jgi:CheY-like chemotaxis protein